MFNTVMVLVFLVLVAVIMWFPGFILAYNMTIAVSERKPTAGDTYVSDSQIKSLLKKSS